MSIRFRKAQLELPPVWSDLVTEVRAVLERSTFHTLDELGTVLPGTPDKRRLSELACGARFPERHELKVLVQACDRWAWPRIEQLFHAAVAERTASAAQPSPRLADHAVIGTTSRLPLVGEFSDWHNLGVHRPITRLATGEDLTAEVDAGRLPAYVLREKDRTELRPVLAAMAASTEPQIRLVLITGESAAGKTRAGVEAIRAELRQWRLLIPHSAARLERVLDDHLDLRHTVVWLDEVQELLGQPTGVEQLNRLLALPNGPTVLLATLRTDAEAALFGTAGWRLLDGRAHRVTLQRRPPPAEFDQELARARELDDPWIVEALDRIGDRYGIAEWLAAGPQLVRHLDRARTSSKRKLRIAAAIVDAAIDCYRAGYNTPIAETVLYEVHHLYLEDHTKRTSPGLFITALRWAQRPVVGASGMLEHHCARGERAFDYLLSVAQHSFPTINSGIWTTLLHHATRKILPSLAVSAQQNGRHEITAEYTRRAAAAGLNLASLLSQLRNVQALRELADNGDGTAAWRLVRLLDDRDDEVGLLEHANTGLQEAGERLIQRVAARNDEEGLRVFAAAGYSSACNELVQLLKKRADDNGLRELIIDDVDGAAFALTLLLHARRDEQGLRERANAGDSRAAYYLAELLYSRGDEHALRERAATGDHSAAYCLVKLFAERADETSLRERADTGDAWAGEQLVDLLRARRDEQGLRQLRERTGPAYRWADDRLVKLLADIGDGRALQELRERAEAHYEPLAGGLLADLLYDRGDEQGLRRLVAAGYRHAADRLVDLLALRDDETALHELANRGYPTARERLLDWLASRGDEQGLRELADIGYMRDRERRVDVIGALDPDERRCRAQNITAGDERAGERLVEMLVQRADVAALRERAIAGHKLAGQRLVELLAHRGDEQALWELAELSPDRGDAQGQQAYANSGLLDANDQLAKRLYTRGDEGGLRKLTTYGRWPSLYLANLLADHGDERGLQELADAGDDYADFELARLLADRGDERSLRKRADAGSQQAAQNLAWLLAARGDQLALHNPQADQVQTSE